MPTEETRAERGEFRDARARGIARIVDESETTARVVVTFDDTRHEDRSAVVTVRRQGPPAPTPVTPGQTRSPGRPSRAPWRYRRL